MTIIRLKISQTLHLSNIHSVIENNTKKGLNKWIFDSYGTIISLD